MGVPICKGQKKHKSQVIEIVQDQSIEKYFSQEEEIDEIGIYENQFHAIEWKNTNQLLGHGSFGIVYLGINNETGQLMAVKQVFLSGNNNQKQRINALKLEIDMLSRLDHPNIVKYYGMEQTTQNLNIFLEYVAGGSLQQLLVKYGKFQESLIKIYTKQILLGLNYLHSHRVIHRDIKGANVLVDNQSTCKLTDFGSSKKLHEVIQKEDQRSLIGTVNWMAPEVINQSGHGRFADIWSVGCTIIEMATGKPPWSELNISNQISLMMHIAKTNKPPALPQNLSETCQSFLKCCLQIKPKDRWNVKKLLKHSFVENESHKQSYQNKTDELMSMLNQSKFKQTSEIRQDNTPSKIQEKQKEPSSIIIVEEQQEQEGQEGQDFQRVIEDQKEKVQLDTQQQKKLEELLLRGQIPEQCKDGSKMDQKSKSDSSSSGNNNLNSQLAQLYMKQFQVKESQSVQPNVKVQYEEEKNQSHIDKRITAESE